MPESKTMEYNSAGQLVYPTFMNPCPGRCGLTGGCNKCRIKRTFNNSFTIPSHQPYKITERTPYYDQYEGLTSDEEKRFYEQVMKSKFF